MLSNIIDCIKLPFRKEKELYASIYNITGYYPHDIDIYKLALTPKSADSLRGARYEVRGARVNNERLEFLGDAILDAVVGHIVFDHFSNKSEGFLTNTRSKLVQRETLGRLAKEVGLNKLVRINHRASSHNSYVGGNAFEALVGALYLDRGYSACMRFMTDRILDRVLNIDKVAFKEVNFKSKLLEWSQKNRVQVEFRLLSENKGDHSSPVFNYQVLLAGIAGSTGTGYSKKESQQEASKHTLKRLKDPLFLDEVLAAKMIRVGEYGGTSVGNDGFNKDS